MSTCRPFSRGSHFTIYFQGHHSSNSSLCSHWENISACLQGANELKAYQHGLWCLYFLTIWSKACMACLSGGIPRTWLKISKAQQHMRTWHGQVVLWEGINVDVLGFPQTPMPVMHFTLAKTKKCYCCLPPRLSRASPKPWAKSRPSKPSPTTELSHGLRLRQHRDAPGWMPFLTHHQGWHQGHQRAKTKTDNPCTSLSKHHSPIKTFPPE